MKGVEMMTYGENCQCKTLSNKDYFNKPLTMLAFFFGGGGNHTLDFRTSQLNDIVRSVKNIF